jgi:hypothetical protein
MSNEEFELKLLGVKPKYQKQFREIYNSNESFKGDFNIMAFLFGGIWALTKGLWLLAIVAITIAIFGGIFTAGFGFIGVWLYFGFRGTYLYYMLKIHGKQVIL